LLENRSCGGSRRSSADVLVGGPLSSTPFGS
jgi:hypothetical protein